MSKPFYEPPTPDIKEGLEAEYQMWGYDFKRLNAILEVITSLFLQLPENPDAAMSIAYALKEFYSGIRILFVPSKKEEYDQRFKDLFIFVQQELKRHQRQRDMSMDIPLNIEVFNRLDTMRDDLMEMRQVVGLGIPAQKKINKKARLKGALTGK